MRSIVAISVNATSRVGPVSGASRAGNPVVAFFVVPLLVACLFLQRFGIPFGSQFIQVAGPIGLGLAGVALLQGRLVFNRIRLSLFLLLLVLVCAGCVYNAGDVVAFSAAISLPSLFQFLLLTFFTTFEFAEAMDESLFFRTVTRFLLYIAVAGAIQFVLQFVGIRIFSFGRFLPGAIVAEAGWNLEIPFGIGDLYKSNGFFLVEPSVTSQFMSLGVIIEILFFKRLLYLGMFLLTLLLSLSGTGGFVLFAFLLASALRLGWRGLLTALLLLTLMFALAGAVTLLAPDVAGLAQSRLSEFNTPGTSGHLRFITPFWLISDVFHSYPMAALLGLGSGTSEHLTMPYVYDTNTPIKIGMEYGLPALVLYILLFVVGSRTPRQSVLVLPTVVLLMFTGSYQQFPPVIFLVALLVCTARLAVSEGGGLRSLTPAAGLGDSVPQPFSSQIRSA